MSQFTYAVEAAALATLRSHIKPSMWRMRARQHFNANIDHAGLRAMADVATRHGVRTIPAFDVAFYGVTARLLRTGRVVRSNGRYSPRSEFVAHFVPSPPAAPVAPAVVVQPTPAAAAAVATAQIGTMRAALESLTVDADSAAILLQSFDVAETARLVALLGNLETLTTAVRALIAEEGVAVAA